MMCLKSQMIVRLRGRQPLEPVRQPAALEDISGAIGGLPKSINCHAELVRIAPPLGKFTGARIGLGCLGC